ncbi:MAG TPA: DUF2095 family protein [Candidatus Acidoferrum sp.]|nr:DUF2095 family protein [Candidatus Acidoferrum sp.]
MTFTKEALKKMFPELAKELDRDDNNVPISSIRTNARTGENVSSKSYVHYVPDVIDFIRRCDTSKQAEEIIDYMEKRGEIETQYAAKLRKQLKETGLRSFGSKKERDYYLRHGEL